MAICTGRLDSSGYGSIVSLLGGKQLIKITRTAKGREIPFKDCFESFFQMKFERFNGLSLEVVDLCCYDRGDMGCKTYAKASMRIFSLTSQ